MKPLETPLIDYELMLQLGLAPHDVDALPGHVRAYLPGVITPRDDTTEPTCDVTISPPRVPNRAPRWWTRGWRRSKNPPQPCGEPEPRMGP